MDHEITDSHEISSSPAETVTGAISSNSVDSDAVIEVISSANVDLLEASEASSAERPKANVSESEKEACVAVDAGCAEKVCRICHLNSEHRLDGLDLLQLGCGCKDELGIAHQHCAETWFKMKGNRCCEICGGIAKNITGVGEKRFMVEWNERRRLRMGSSSSSERGRCWTGQPFCNFVMACLVIAFVLPWFFHVNLF